MSFVSDLFTAENRKALGAFVLKHVKIGILKANGCMPKPKAESAIDLQCVRINKEHGPVVKMVSQWCALRANKLRQLGSTADAVNRIILSDARFLTSLSHAVGVQKDPDPLYDGWLFFDKDVQTTGFFELVQCIHGSKDVLSSLVIRIDR